MAKSAKSASKKTTAKKAVGKKAVTAKAPAAKSAGKKPSAKNVSTKNVANKPTAKKSPAKKTTGNKTTAKKTIAKAKVAAPSPTPPKKQPVKTPFDKKFLDEMKEALVSERSRYVTSAELLKAEADSLIEGREPGDVQFDEESGDGDTVAVERERDLALSAQARAAVDEIDEALERLAGGTYGVCLASEKPIPKERLRAIPWASERVEYKAGGFGLR